MPPELTIEAFHTLRPAANYEEAFGTVLWWHLPKVGAPTVGGSLRGRGMLYEMADKPASWYTHWSPLPDNRHLVTSDGAQVQVSGVGDVLEPLNLKTAATPVADE